MHSIDSAFELLLAATQPLMPVDCPLDRARGRILAEPVISSVATPPFDKSLMDGFAVRLADCVVGEVTLEVIERVMAGQVPQKSLRAGATIQVMTGAPLPAETDLVVRREDVDDQGGSAVFRFSHMPRGGEHLIRRGTTLKPGAELLPAGIPLLGPQLGALAEIGCTSVKVRPAPRAAIIATGDELVPWTSTPGPGQIRNSNELMLTAMVEQMGAIAQPLGIARDQQASLREKIQLGLQADLLILAGGVSAGDLDLVPATLKSVGVREVFHQVALKPGKPVWFGVYEPPTGPPKPVVGLPGNPVSSMICAELFVRTALRRLQGYAPARSSPLFAQLRQEHVQRKDRPTFHLARWSQTADGLVVELIPWHGSSDLPATVHANGMVYVDGEPRTYPAGSLVPVYDWTRTL